MTVIPVYNKLIAPDSDVYFRRDQFRYLAGNVNVDEKVVLDRKSTRLNSSHSH